MSELYGRIVEVLIGPRGQNGKLFRDLRVSFKIEKSLESSPNNASIQIYNLAASSRSLVEQDGAVIQLRAGYQENTKILYLGDIARTTTKRSGGDIITEIEAGDGEFAYQNATANVSLGPGAKYSQVFQAIGDRLGLSQGSVKIPNPNDQFQQGYSFSGAARDALDILSEKQGLEWNIQDGQLQALPAETTTDESVIVLNSGSGLVGSPFKTKILRPDLARIGKGKEESGVKVVSLLNPEIRPGRRIQVEAEFVNGIFKVEKVTHSGDTHSSQFYSEVEAR